MFLYARSEQCDLVPIYTITNTRTAYQNLSIILEKSAILAMSLRQLSSSSFHMFLYARSEQCDLVPIYTITNTRTAYQNLSIILEKSAILAMSLRQLSSSSFHMFMYHIARSEQCDLVPIYTITNTQRIRIYPGKLKFILVKISSDVGQRKPNSIHVSCY